MKILYINLFLLLGFGTCNSQDLKTILTNSKNERNPTGYFDRKGINYYSSDVNGMQIKTLLDSVTFNSADTSFVVKGQSVLNFVDSERFGYCCIAIFLGSIKGDSLINLTEIARTNSIEDNPKKPDGFFRIVIKPKPQQSLIFSTHQGQGLEVFNLDAILRAALDVKYF